MKRDAIDLSTLNVFTLFRKYFVPTLLGMLSMSAVTAIDGIFVGHGVGSDGIAAVNICVPLLMLLTGIGLMVGAGCSVVASIQLSRGKSKSARLNVTQALLFVTIVALIPSALMMAFPAETARMLGSSEHLLPMVTDYLLWFVPSWVFQIWITVPLFVIRLDGAPKLAMLCSLITAVINVVLDWLFIFPFGWGVMGAAFATSISIMAGGLVAMVYLLFYARHLRLQPLKWSVKSLRLSVRNIGYQCRIGPSALLGEATLAVLMFVGNQVFMSYLGDDGVGAFGIACYYIPFVFMVGNAIAQSAQPIISYNFGLGYKERVMTAERIALLTAVVCGVVATVAFTVYPYLLVGLFISLDSEAAKIAIHGFPYFASGFVFFIVNIAVVGYFQSVERIKPATIFALLRGFVFLIPSFILLPKFLGVSGIWLAMPLSEALTIIVILLFVLKWKIQCKLPPKTKRFCPLKTFNNAPLKSLDRWGYYYFSLFPSVCSHFTDTFSCQLNPVRRMYNTIHNGICYCRVSDCIIPIVRWQLRGDDDGLAPMSVLYYIEQDGSFLGIKVHKEEVIQYEQRAPFDSLEFRFQCAFYFCHLKRTHKFRSIRIICPYALLAGFIPHCCGKEALPGTG